MLLYLRNDLLKSESDAKPKASKKGEQRGGDYVARAQVGYDKDGSAKYRYFDSEEEYQSFLSAKGRSKGAKELESKVKKEHEESSDKQKQGNKHQPTRKPGLLVKDKPVAKSIRLFVRT